MVPQSILIADPLEAFRSALADSLMPEFQVQVCASGEEALAILARQMPDMLVLALRLPGMDGIEVLRRMAQRDWQPRVLAITDDSTDFLGYILGQLGVSYALTRSASVSTAAQRAREILDFSQFGDCPERLERIMGELSMPLERQGCQNLRTGLPMLARHRDQRLSKELYDAIAARNRTTTDGVEKSIREAIHTGWNRGDRSVWLRYFPGITRCPRNKEFLFRLAQLLDRCG